MLKRRGAVFFQSTPHVFQAKVYWIYLFQKQQPAIDGDIGKQPLIRKLVLLVWNITVEYIEKMNISNRSPRFICFADV